MNSVDAFSYDMNWWLDAETHWVDAWMDRMMHRQPDAHGLHGSSPGNELAHTGTYESSNFTVGQYSTTLWPRRSHQ